MELPQARESFKKVATWYDRVFVKHLIKGIQSVNPDIGAMIFPEAHQIVFYWKRIIVYKVWMDEYNTTDVTIEEHKRRVAQTIQMIKDGLINIQPMQNNARHFNKNKTGKILT